jgi:anti-sigma factor RsiW
MSDHITEWLGAYHDGELRGGRRRRIEAHLAGCAACRAELAEIRNLSALLADDGLMTDFFPADRFAANLALSLPRRSASPQRRSRFELAWWLVPVGLLLTWVFVDITFSLSSAITVLANTGLFGGEASWLQQAPLRMDWFDAALRLFGDTLGAPGVGALRSINNADLLLTRLAERLLPQALLAGAYLGWLLAWWLSHQPRYSHRSLYDRRS